MGQERFGPPLRRSRIEKLGDDIAVVVKRNRDGSVKSVEPFITGFIVDNK
jgi:hypothetical protein